MAYAPSRTRTVFSSEARTADATSRAIENPGGATAVRFRVNVSAIAATPSVVFNVQGRTPAGSWETLLQSAAVTGTGDTVLTVGQGLTAAANVTANGVVPSAVRLFADHGDADSITYSATVEFFG
jgi:hypothetical protein